jgi:hypothetical protein
VTIVDIKALKQIAEPLKKLTFAADLLRRAVQSALTQRARDCGLFFIVALFAVDSTALSVGFTPKQSFMLFLD